MLDRIRIVLTEPSHPGNIGATARAMKNMGLSQLTLVNPADFPSAVATARASGADDLLANASVVNSLAAAIADCHWVLGTSARQRTLEQTLLSPRQVGSFIAEKMPCDVAIVFGRESSGLNNQELKLCHRHIVIPTNPAFSSLNLAQAVQLISYEIYQASMTTQISTAQERPIATQQQVQGFMQHLEETLVAIDFIDPKQPRKLMQRLQHLYNRAELDVHEIDILRGMLSRVNRLQKIP